MICKNCSRHFTPADRASAGANTGAYSQIRYCSQQCARQARNRRYYQRHRAAVIARNLKNQGITPKEK